MRSSTTAPCESKPESANYVYQFFIEVAKGHDLAQELQVIFVR